ncbi:hypothetical protein AVEN_235500-1 [Araneus ventricosus]|uniref:Uncharacterized protein n=1 Tax=Araneus ventricosus TaxID=182803 RepID=A0A4Y2A595_ARAVE|nr:hypothetical protein AVEN_235500-1 [Araneus ventricosus]
MLTSRFEATRELFWDGPRNFESRSDDENDTLSPNFRTTPARGRLVSYVLFRMQQTRIYSESSVESGFKPTGHKAETLPLGHYCLRRLLRGRTFDHQKLYLSIPIMHHFIVLIIEVFFL